MLAASANDRDALSTESALFDGPLAETVGHKELLRVCELAGGSIAIDGVDVSLVGLGELRARLGLIPQDATLFAASVRFNLDPFEEHADAAVWAALCMTPYPSSAALSGAARYGRSVFSVYSAAKRLLRR